MPRKLSRRYDRLKTAFRSTIQHFGCIYFVLDALDECTLDQRNEICEFISSITRTTSTDPSQGIVKVFVTSREKPNVEQHFQQQAIPTIEVEVGKVGNDMEVYLNAQIELRLQNRSLKLSNMALKDKILGVLAAKSGGT